MAAIVYTGNLAEILSRDAGFERANTLLFDLRPGELGYEGERLQVFYRNAEEALRGIPGVVQVGISRTRPMLGGGFHDRVHTPGNERGTQTAVDHATSGFLAALGIPLIAGRGFTPQEVRDGSRVAVISETLAKELDLSSPLGARIVRGDGQWGVIGIARNAGYSRLTHPMPVLYVPFPNDIRSATVVLRTSANPLAMVAAAREAVRSIDGSVPLIDVFTMEQQISRTLQRERMFAWLCGSFGVLALVLCVVGLYGLMSHATARRIPEIGIRMALGASAREVMRQVVGEGMRLAFTGMLLGIPLAIYAAKLAQRQNMLSAGPLPYWTLTATLTILIVSALIATIGPALRAACVDPMRALRQG
jgi:ABC-type antimicrobial peptide transport system permease subunit